MLKYSALFILATLLSGCVTQTTYSSQMYGNNPNTATANNNKEIKNKSGASILDTGAPEQCSNCSRKIPIITPAK